MAAKSSRDLDEATRERKKAVFISSLLPLFFKYTSPGLFFPVEVWNVFCEFQNVASTSVRNKVKRLNFNFSLTLVDLSHKDLSSAFVKVGAEQEATAASCAQEPTVNRKWWTQRRR